MSDIASIDAQLNSIRKRLSALEKDLDGLKCSVCGKIFPSFIKSGHGNLPNFQLLCPSCAEKADSGEGKSCSECMNPIRSDEQWAMFYFCETCNINLPERERSSTCPCTLVEPCKKNCTCARGLMSGGCLRCATYGSHEQQIEAAKRLAGPSEEVVRLRDKLIKTVENLALIGCPKCGHYHIHGHICYECGYDPGLDDA